MQSFILAQRKASSSKFCFGGKKSPNNSGLFNLFFLSGHGRGGVWHHWTLCPSLTLLNRIFFCLIGKENNMCLFIQNMNKHKNPHIGKIAVWIKRVLFISPQVVLSKSFSTVHLKTLQCFAGLSLTCKYTGKKKSSSNRLRQ